MTIHAWVCYGNVLQVLKEKGWKLGGESSGHIICLDKSTTGDGIVAALEVLAAMVASGQALDDLVAGMTKFPQVLVNVRTEQSALSSKQIMSHDQVAMAVQDVENCLNSEGRVVLRPSGTEPLIRVMVEGRDPGLVQKYAQQIADSVHAVGQA